MAANTDTRRRVKLYQLDDDGKWEDRGTGQVACLFVEPKNGVYLVVKSEDDGSVLLESKVHAEDIYQRQQATLIVWNEPDTSVDLALSFQEAEGCQDIWEQIAAYQQKVTGDAGESDNENGNLSESEHTSFLPPANLNNVDAILDTVIANSAPAKRDRFVLSVIKEDYVRKLLQLFKLCEDFEDKPVLYTMFSIFKNLVLLNDTNLMEILFSEEFMIQVMGVLEYDPDISEPNRMKHREFLTSNAIFKQVIPFTSTELVEKIHQTFRMQYLKDVVLNRVLDDPTFATINSLIFFNNVEIVSQLQNDSKLIGDIFTKLKSDTTSTQRKDTLLFIHEMCNLAKNLQIPNRIQLYKTLTEQGLFDVITTSLADENVATRMACTDILNLTLSHDPSLLRGFTAHQRPDYPLLRCLVERFTSDPQIGVKSQCAEILKILLDTDAVGEEPGVKEEFLNVFYQHFIKLLVQCLKRKNDPNYCKTGSPKENGIEGASGSEESKVAKEEKTDGEPSKGMDEEKQVTKDSAAESKENEKEKEKEKEKEDTPKVVEEAKGNLPVVGMGGEHRFGRADLSAGFVQNNVCELLSYCIRHHGYRIRYFLLGGNAVQKVLKLLDHKDSFLVLAAVRFFRTFVGANDDFYNRHIIKNNLFAPIVKVFEANGAKYNLINSAILELFDFVRKENVRMLIPYIVENFGEMMKKVTYVDVFKQLLNKHEQMMEAETRRTGTDKIITTNGPRKTQKQIEEEDEEDYFRENEDEGKDGPAKPKDEPQFKEMPKKEEEESPFSLLSKKGDNSKKREEPPRKFRENTPRKFREVEVESTPTGAGKNEPPARIKFKIGASDSKSGDAPSGLGLVDYSSDDDEDEKADKEKEKEKDNKEKGEGSGSESGEEKEREGAGQVRERANSNGDTTTDGPASKRIKTMDERDEYARSSPPQSTAT